jgi:hypothetical protein
VDKRRQFPRVAFVALAAVSLACSQLLPKLPDSAVPSAPETAAPAVPSAIYTEGANSAQTSVTVEATTALTARSGPGEGYPTITALNGGDPYFQHGERLWIVHDDTPACQSDGRGNIWLHVGSDRGLIGWAAAYYDGQFYLYPIPPDCK